jgi:hypothetical protein
MTTSNEGGVAMSDGDFRRLLPGPRSLTIEELAREQGVRPVRSLDDMRADLWDSDEELDQFLRDVRAARQDDLG